MLETTTEFLISGRGLNALYLANHEMNEIKELKHHLHETINQFGNIFYMYFGANDDWVPQAHYHSFTKKYPHAHATLCKDEIPHAFVEHHSTAMAINTLKMIKINKRVSEATE